MNILKRKERREHGQERERFGGERVREEESRGGL